MDLLTMLFVALSIPLLWTGALNLGYLPLALAYELRRRPAAPAPPPISIVVPAYNEGRVIGACVESILACGYPHLQLILVNDGSTDDTLARMQRFSHVPGVLVVDKPNGGKAGALNAGLAHATGEYVFCVDADGLFTSQTIPAMLAAFDHPRVGAVCGNDVPLNLDRPQTHLAAIQTHVGTGFVRRALDYAGCLPIVSGNCGAFRRSVLAQIGGFREHLLGEDLELTWRVHRAGFQVRFAPRALVQCEVPATLGGLWKQRVRWARGLLQTTWLHRDMVANPRFGRFGLFLGLNIFSMVVVPMLQLISLTLLLVLAVAGYSPVELTLLGLMGWLGIGMSFAIAVIALVFDRAWAHARFLYALPLWLPYSLLLSLVMARAIYLELRGATRSWNKLERVGLDRAPARPPEPRRSPVRRPAAPGSAQTVRLARRTPDAASLLAAGVLLLGVGGGIGQFVAGVTAIPTGAVETPRATTAPGAAQVPTVASPLPAVPPIRAVGVDLRDMQRDPDALDALATRLRAAGANMVGLSAGRLDWTSFRWEGHPDRWAEILQDGDRDLLAENIVRFGEWAHVSAVVDVFAPRYLAQYPEQRAINAEGVPLAYQASTSALLHGPFGDELIALLSAIAAHYPVDSITLTELFYYREGYGADDLAAFQSYSGLRDWPRTATGSIDVDHPAIGAWRSAAVAQFVARAAAAVQRHGKQLFVDVRVNWDNPADEGRRSGQDYALLLAHADRLVLWNYFGLSGAPPEYTGAIAAYAQRYGKGRMIISYGLWATYGQVLSPAALHTALVAGEQHQLPHAWIAPSGMLTDEHWRVLVAAWGHE